METVGKQRQYLRPERVYSQQDIQRRMGLSFGRASGLLESVLAKCAEVSQAMMYEVVDLKENTVEVKRVGGRVNHEHYCANCQKRKVRATHNYCPHCGLKIIWIT